MKIMGRMDEPWGKLFAFHFLSSADESTIAKCLSNSVRKATTQDNELNQSSVVETANDECRIVGCLLEPKQCGPLLSAWNEPDGQMYYMCYTPNHGIATVTNGIVDWFALICFQCMNAGIAGPGSQDLGVAPNRTLPDGEATSHAIAQQLRALLPPRPFPERA